MGKEKRATYEREVEQRPLTGQELIDLLKTVRKEDLLAITISSKRGVTIPLATCDGVDFDFDPTAKGLMQQKEGNRKKYQHRLECHQSGSRRNPETKKQTVQIHGYQDCVRYDNAFKTSRKLLY